MCISKSAQNNDVTPPPPPAHPSLQQSRRYFGAENVTRLRLLFAVEFAFAYPADRVTNRSVYRSP